MCVAMEVANSAGGGDDGRVASVGSSARQSPKVPMSTPLAASPAATQLQLNPASPSVPRKIISKNGNGTMVVTSTPNNDAELQLYRVMQKASLLAYYDTLLEMGGDDVQQLCDAGEEEFLEIMALVGMASKPLHVRRLQKSLQEWVTNPSQFQVPLIPGNANSETNNHFPTSPRIPNNHGVCCTDISLDNNRPMYSPSPGAHDLACALPPVTSPGLSLSKSRPYSPLDMPSCPTSTGSSPGSGNSLQLTPALLESQITRLAASAERLSKHLPQLEPKPQNTKKKMCKELEIVMAMPETDPRRMEEIRRYAAIYGRFDCKRRPEKPLTLHEVSVNEAAAQICRFVPALLTRRDELFPLARQVVRDSGYHYSKTTPHISSQCVSRGQSFDRDSLGSDHGNHRGVSKLSSSGHDSEGPSSKRSKLDTDQESDDQMTTRQHQPKSNMQPSRDIMIRGPSSPVADSDDTDSHFSFSNSSSPSQISVQEQENSYSGDALNNCQQRTSSAEPEDIHKYSPKVQVIAASGDNIIAVANPALAMSPAILPSQKRGESRTLDDP